MNHHKLFLLLCLLSCFNTHLLADDDDGDQHEDIQIIDGQAVIELDEESQQSSGLKTQKFNTIQFKPESIHYGQAISIQPILSTLNQYLSISAKQASAKARLANTQKTITRLRNLHKNQAVSIQKLQHQQALWQADKAIYDAMVYQNNLIISSSRLQWGEKISQWSIGRQATEFDSLLAGKSTLLTVSFPFQQGLRPASIFISPSGSREHAFSASFVSVLPHADKHSQGLLYSFISDSSKIKPGMNFTAWIPENTAKTGYIIPESALAWHLGQSFIFIKIDAEHFIHRPIHHPHKVANGYFISEPLAATEEVVVSGTQMLLSHEFRSQIPDEDDD